VAGLRAQGFAARIKGPLRGLGVARDHQQNLLVIEGLLRAGVAGVAGLAGEHVAEPPALALDQGVAIPVHRSIGQVVVNLHDQQLVALAHDPAVALLEVRGGPGQIEVMHRAAADLQVDALVGDRVGDDHVVLRRHPLAAPAGAGTRRGRLGGDAIELAGDADAVGPLGLDRVEDGDALARHPVGDQHLAHPQVHGGRLAEDDVPAARAGGHALGAGRQLGRGVIGGGDGGERLVVFHAAVELCVQGDEREAREQAEDLVLAAALDLRLLERALELSDELAVQVLLLGAERHADLLDARLGQGQARLDAGAKLAVAVDDRAHVVEIFEAVDDAAHRHLERHVDDLAALDAQEAVDELLGVHQAAAGERVRVDQLDQVVELERRVLGRRRGQQDDARAARALADRGGAKVELPGALAAVAAAAHEFRKTVLAGLGLVAVFEGRGLVDDQHVDADVVPGDAGVELVALGQLEHLLDEGAHAVLEDRPVALGQVVGLLLGGVALAQLDLALEALDGLDVVQQRLLVHLGARERVVAQDHHVVEAGLEGAPLRGALLGCVGLRGEQALALAAGDLLAVAADHQHAVVGEYAQKVVVPLPDQRARHEYDWAADPALLPRRRDDADGGVGLADADVEGD
jgi:hypothetical protein